MRGCATSFRRIDQIQKHEHANGNGKAEPQIDGLTQWITEVDRWQDAVITAIRALQSDVELMQVEIDRLQRERMI